MKKMFIFTPSDLKKIVPTWSANYLIQKLVEFGFAEKVGHGRYQTGEPVLILLLSLRKS